MGRMASLTFTLGLLRISHLLSPFVVTVHPEGMVRMRTRTPCRQLPLVSGLIGVAAVGMAAAKYGS